MEYNWQPQPEAQKLILDILNDVMARSPEAAALADRMRRQTGTRFQDWLDFIRLPQDDDRWPALLEAGFESAGQSAFGERHEHHGGLFPQLVRRSDAERDIDVGLKAESVSDFLTAMEVVDSIGINGLPMAPIRMARAFAGDGANLWAVERHGTRGFDDSCEADRCLAAWDWHDHFRRRRRHWDDDSDGWTHLHSMLERAVDSLGPDAACDVFFASEREYWQRRNRAAQIQKARQDQLGLGWANHDHHTYRSSRAAFANLVKALEILGFHCRERFYAGEEAGWGAQVLEQPTCGIVIFADVDLNEAEVAGDFAHEGLNARDYLGTVGLWVGLHGESMFDAGLHHLECQFDHDALRDQLQAAGIGTMDPFTNLPHLRQAFTDGERWRVDERRINRLLEKDLITSAQASQFRMHGAIGSHLENLQREDGYKGFNQKGVSDIIARTDPRKHASGELIGA